MRDKLADAVMVLALFIATVAIVLLGTIVLRQVTTVSPTQAHDSLGVTYTYNGEAIRWYVFTDPDTGVQYLVNDRGGCIERSDG